MDKVIFHVDVNSAYLSWEAVARLKQGDTVDLRQIPSAVGGDEQSRHGVVLAKSKPAQAFGIKTGETLYSARQKCPGLVVVPSNFPMYTTMSRILIEFLNDYCPIVEQLSIDECFLDYTGLERLYGPPVEAAHNLKQRIKEQFGFTVNIGVAPNKILAKMAGELEKPDLVHTMFHSELPEKLWPQPVRNLYMVGEKTEQALSLYNITTIGDLAKAPADLLATILKSHGMAVWRYANGIDSSPVLPTGSTLMKSYSNSTTLSHDVTNKEEAFTILLKLCQSVCMRMRNESFTCQTVTVQIKYSDFSVTSKQHHMKKPADDTDALYTLAKELFSSLWSGAPVRLLGVSLSDLTEAQDQQITIFSDMARRKHQKLDAVCDDIRKKFGNYAITFGTELQSDDIGALDRFFPENKPEKKK